MRALEYPGATYTKDNLVINTNDRLKFSFGPFRVWYFIANYHDDNGIFDTEIEDIETGENIYIGSTLGKRIIDELDEYDNDNDNTSSTGDSVKDVINEYIANQQAKNDNVSVSEKVNYFLAELGINDDDIEDQIHNLIIHHIDVPCSAELDNQMYNESI